LHFRVIQQIVEDPFNPEPGAILMSTTSLTADNLAWLLTQRGPLLPGLLKVIGMNPGKPIESDQLLRAVAVYRADRRTGIQGETIGVVQQDSIQAVFDQCPEAVFAAVQGLLRLFAFGDITQDTDGRQEFPIGSTAGGTPDIKK